MSAMTPALIAELRDATAVIYAAACRAHTAETSAVTTAHRTLVDRRNDVIGDLLASVCAYLDRHTWEGGPFVLRQAIIDLARTAGLNIEDPFDDVVEQLRLFDDETRVRAAVAKPYLQT